MRKRKKGRKFSRETDQRRAFLKALLSALILNKKIKTTEARAKAVSRLADRYITKAKNGDIHAKRLLARVFAPKLVKKLIEELGPAHKDRQGGYTRVIKLGPRKSDGAKMAIIEFVE